jgi:CheY-like chemotaxis protein
MSAQANENTKAPMKVLLVDDDAFVHEMVELLIDQPDYTLLSATNVKAAMELIVQGKPDIIITDAIMPGESGFSLIEKIKADPRTEDIPTILLTILQQPDGSVMDASGKADFCVTKPVYLSDITSALEQARQLIEHRNVVNVHVPAPTDVIKFQLSDPTDAVDVLI